MKKPHLQPFEKQTIKSSLKRLRIYINQSHKFQCIPCQHRNTDHCILQCNKENENRNLNMSLDWLNEVLK